MQVTSLLSQKEHEHKHDHGDEHDHHHHDDPNCSSCGHDHEHQPVRLTQTVVGLIFIINSYVVDFLCLEARLVIEADGPFHDPERDATRDAWHRVERAVPGDADRGGR